MSGRNENININPRKLLELPIVFDVIVGGFGRDASIEYLVRMAARERYWIKQILQPERLTFFDEYRRIMFSQIDDVAYFKATAIEAQVAQGHVDEAILVGGGLTPISQDFVDRVCVSVSHAVASAARRSHRRIRVAIPCNGLSELAVEVGRALTSRLDLERLRERVGDLLPAWSELDGLSLSVETVPEAVLRTVASKDPASGPQHLLLLGTEGTQAAYRGLLGDHSVEISALFEEEQTIINNTIVGSIDGDPQTLHELREQVMATIVRPRLEDQPDTIVVEACTDMHLGIGISSLEMFANYMVDSCYEVAA